MDIYLLWPCIGSYCVFSGLIAQVFLRNIGKHKLLTADEERILAAKVQDYLALEKTKTELEEKLGR